MQSDETSARRLWGGANVLVTGARGFVGRRLVRYLVGLGATVSQLVHSPDAFGNDEEVLTHAGTRGRLIHASVTDFKTVQEVVNKRGISTVFHLAALNANRGTKVSPYALFEANVRGTYTILEASRMAAKAPQVVVLSSRESEPCFDPLRTKKIHPYAASKASAELIATSFADTFGLRVVALRAGNIYGGGDLNWDRLIPLTIRSFVMGQCPVMRGAMQERRDYIYVDDVVTACVAAATMPVQSGGAAGTIRITSGCEASTAEIVLKLANAIGRDDLVPSIVATSIREPSRSKTTYVQESGALDWSSKTDIEDGLVATVRWYQRYLSRTCAY